MDKKVKILIVDDNPEVSNSINNYFIHKKNFEICGIARDGIEALKLIEADTPDIIIMDLILPNADGFYLMDKIRNNILIQPKIIVISCLSQESIISQSSSLGADYYIIKPFSLEVLYNRIVEICKKQYTISNKSVEEARLLSLREKIIETLGALGVPSNTKGFKYLIECIITAIKEPQKAYNLSKGIYPLIALSYGTSSVNVERAIRHTIELTWNNIEESTVKRLGFKADKKSSNKQFINSIIKSLY